ncbi:MAG TPA: cytochrome ubiquinol oxidase subunit I [Gemmatimonadales bacterium]|jgi:cytochrome d ubiquinol oxidase subunit I
MPDALPWHRLQFAFTITYHYLFPQLTMGLAPLIVLWKWLGLRTGEPHWDESARFWSRILGLTFALGVVTGLPMEFQFGTNWSYFSRYAGGVIGQTLAMEGMLAFLLESALIAALVFGERRFSRKAHFTVAAGVCAGAWISAFFILVTNAFMQYPKGYTLGIEGQLVLSDIGSYLFNAWTVVEFAHNQLAALVTAAFVVSATGAYYTLRGLHREQSRIFLTWGTAMGLGASVLVAWPTGDAQAKLVARHQEVSLAAMEGRFESGPMAPITMIGQPDVAAKRLDNPIRLPGLLSFLAYGTFHGNVRGLGAFPRELWPTEIELLYYAFHVMAGLGTLFVLLTAIGTALSWRGTLESRRWMLWALLLAFPFPFIANTAGWMTAELGRQPWLIYGILRTSDGASAVVSAGNAIFTLIGFCGLYLVLGILYLYMVSREIERGPGPAAPAPGEMAVTEGAQGD